MCPEAPKHHSDGRMDVQLRQSQCSEALSVAFSTAALSDADCTSTSKTKMTVQHSEILTWSLPLLYLH